MAEKNPKPVEGSREGIEQAMRQRPNLMEHRRDTVEETDRRRSPAEELRQKNHRRSLGFK